MPLWWYLPAIGIGVLLGAEVHMGYPGIRAWIGYVVLIPLCVGGLWWLGRTRVRVRDGALSAGDRTLALRDVGRTDTVDRKDKQQALGPQLDPAARLLHRAWIGPIVRVEVTGDGPEPYWVLSTRRPEALMAALDEGRRVNDGP